MTGQPGERARPFSALKHGLDNAMCVRSGAPDVGSYPDPPAAGQKSLRQKTQLARARMTASKASDVPTIHHGERLRSS